MNKKQIIQKINKYVKDRLSGEGSGHDWWHIDRVRKLALKIAQKEKADLFVVELSALLHDIYDYKFYKANNKNAIDNFLRKYKINEEIIQQIAYIVNSISYKGGTNKIKLKSIEAKIVQDADRLDAIGAIGIARTFTYGGKIAREMYNPNIKPKKYKNLNEYKKHLNTNPTVNHFYEKILLLKNTIHTKTGKQMANNRHKYVEQFLNRFFKEWEGKI
ncbi:MAG: HD domain-containing protein [Patescibacteria group bacterium]|jgi:uncharacterized protein